jgi:hypothetical protein
VTAAKNTPSNAPGVPFAKGNPGKPKGAVNRTTAALRQAILDAAEKVGADGKGKGGTTGYLMHLAQREPKAFAALLAKVLPMQITGEGGGPLQVTQIQLVAVKAVE